MFSITQDILQKTEAHLLNLPVEKKLWSNITRYLVFPIKYLLWGLGDFFKPASTWALMAFSFLLIGSIIMNKLEVAPEFHLILMNVCVYAPMVLVLCAVPSTYVNYGVKDVHIENITKFIEESGLDSPDKIELLEENLEKLNERIVSRVSFYKWVLGAAWAIYVVTFNLEIKLLPKSEDINFLKILTKSVTTFWLSMFSAVVILIFITGYKRASEMLIKSIEFACIQSKYCILKNS
ncbi:hypothetical protein N9W21_08405 [Shewanella sp.]|nr:hypothetical protein [Shewanella sp.]